MASTSENQRATVCFVGSFPPAAGGQGLINESFRRMATEAGAAVRTIDLSGQAGPTSWQKRVSRIPKILLGVWNLGALLIHRGADTVYLGVASGRGQLFDVVFAGLTRAAGLRLFLHYDSYAYLAERRRMTAVLVRTAGPTSTHIVGCDDMKLRLTKLYGPQLHVVVVSNATNTAPPPPKLGARTRLRTIGFISYVSRVKGVLEFIDVAERFCRSLPDVQALLAGPIDEPSLLAIVEQRVRGVPWIKYLGPVYGETKSQFYSDIDAFVFPTRYANEADPRVVNEAIAHGVAVIARSRGCIESIIRGGGGEVIREGRDFVSEASKLLLEWHGNPMLFSSISLAAIANSARLESDHGGRLRALIQDMVTVTRPRATVLPQTGA